MANSLRAKIKKLNFEGRINADELKEIMDKIDGHDYSIRCKAIDSFVDECLKVHRESKEPLNLRRVAERVKGQKNEWNRLG